MDKIIKSCSNVSVSKTDIVSAEADVIVNAANGWGYMGGRKARSGLLYGVAESLNCSTKGQMEAFCMKKARRFAHIPSFIFGKEEGEIFTSPGFGLHCKEVIHAVTMHTPAGSSSEGTVITLLENIFKYCLCTGFKTVALPLLGTGTGGLDKIKVFNLITTVSTSFPGLSVCIHSLELYCLLCNFTVDENAKKMSEGEKKEFWRYCKFFQDSGLRSDTAHFLSSAAERKSKDIYITFKFDWDTYNSQILISDRIETLSLDTPHMPLIGACWSDHVATRMAVGQVLVSALMDCVNLWLEFWNYDMQLNMKIHKLDKCFYAPLMYYTVDENGAPSYYNDDCSLKIHYEYLPLLRERYPEAYSQVLKYESGKDFWDKYHDIDQEGAEIIMKSVFNSKQLIGNITELCAEKNMSADCMLRECGLSDSIMNDLEKGFDPPLGKIVVIADFLGVTVDSLINGNFTKERKHENEIL